MAEEYEQWLREEHYPWNRSVPRQTSVEGFSVVDAYDEAVDDPE